MKNIITIIFAYRNRDLQRIKISMDSLERQSKKNFQVIFVDYGSLETYSAPVKETIKSYPFAHYYYVAHSGLLWNKSKAFNFAITKAVTPYILTADVDLLFHPNTVESLERITSSSSFKLFDYGYLPKGIPPRDLEATPFEKFKPTHYGDVNGVGLFPKKALEEIHGFDEFFHFYGSEDVDLFQRLMNAGYKQDHHKEHLFLHQWHPRFPSKKEKELTVLPRLNNVMRINQQHYLRSMAYKKVIPYNQTNWGKCFEKGDSIVLQQPTLRFIVTNVASSVVHFLNEHLSSCKGEIVAVDFIEDPKYLSLKNHIKRILGRREQPVLKLKEINDMVLKKILFDYRHFNYSYIISEDLNKISFAIDLKSHSTS